MKTLKHALSHRQAGVTKPQAVWIWFWYSDATRLAFPLLGLHLVFTVLLVGGFGLNEHLDAGMMRHGLIFQYIVVFGWALLDNDYETLRKVGLSVDRQPLPSKHNQLSVEQSTREL